MNDRRTPLGLRPGLGSSAGPFQPLRCAHGAPQPAKPAGYLAAWLVVFASTIVSGVLACASLGMFWRGFGWSGRDIVQLVSASVVFGPLVAAPVGVVSATLCCFTLKFTPTRRVIRLILVPSVIVGVVSAPFVNVYSAGFVVIAQVIVSLLVRVPEDADAHDPNVCAECGYSLIGMDRAKTTVCPECGGEIGCEET